MKTLCAIAVALSWIVHLALASPLSPYFREAGENIRHVDPAAVSTELTLGWNPAVYENAAGNAHHMSGVSQQHATGAYHLPSSSNSNQNPLASSASTSWQRGKEAIQEAPPSQAPAFLHTPLALERAAMHPVQAHLDYHFSHLLQVPNRPGWMQLPKDIIYVESPWLKYIHADLLERGAPFFSLSDRPPEVQIGQEMLRNIVTGSKKLVVTGHPGSMYRVRYYITGSSEPMELLFKYHGKLLWENKEKLMNTMSYWSTAGAGSHLAFLGLFRISERAWQGIKGLPYVETFAQNTQYGGTEIERTVLIPEPKPQSQ